MRDFRTLQVWQKAHREVLQFYRETATFPLSERFGLVSQLRRAAASIAANLAEGCGRRSGADSARLFQVSMGSASELEYHLLLAHDLALLDRAAYTKLAKGVVEVKRMLAALLRKMRRDHPVPGRTPLADR